MLTKPYSSLIGRWYGIVCLCMLSISMSAQGQTAWPYKNAQLTIEQRVQDLLQRMTPEEKFRQLFMVAGELGSDSAQFAQGLFGFQINSAGIIPSAQQQMMHYAAGPDAAKTLQHINRMQRFFVEDTRLGIPMIAFDEALHGLVRTGATSFPQAIAMAATFDTTLMSRVAIAMAEEVRARGLRMVLSPVLNVATDVRWGRVEETYGEDPYLCAMMGYGYIHAMESHGIITTPKHFIANHGDGGRDSYPVYWSDRLLREVYLPPFAKAFRDGGARSLMTAYNSLDGRPCTANDDLLNRVLRREMGFDGFVISDAAATGGANVLHFTASDYEDAGKQSIEHGLDVIFQSDFSSYELFAPPFLKGQVNSAAVDTAVARVLRAKFQLGLFDAPYVSDSLIQHINMKAHRALALEMAIKSAVLLENRHQTLPINAGVKKIAVFGPDAVEARLGGYSGPGNEVTSILEGIQKRAGSQTEVQYARGCERVLEPYSIVPAEVLFHPKGKKLEPGWMGRYYDDPNFESKAVFERMDARIAFQWTLFGPDGRLPYDHYGVQWEGVLVPDTTGTFEIGIRGNDGYKMYINDTLIIDRSQDQSFHTTVHPYPFVQGQAVRMRIEYSERSGNARFEMVWNRHAQYNEAVAFAEAVRIANESDLAIVVVGIEEGEFRDRSTLELPGNQVAFLEKMASLATPVVVVIVGGSAITMESWGDEVESILDVWYPGEAGGEAVAALLSGDVSPSGKLPITFPRGVGQLPLSHYHAPTGRGDDYLDGSGQARYPFGYGKSYTTFEYSHLHVSREHFHPGEEVEVTFTITNTGAFAGDEVVQVYLRDEVASVSQPIKKLRHFERVHLASGEKKNITIRLTPEDFTLLDEQLHEVIEEGSFRLMIGSSSKDIRLRQLIHCKK